MIDIGKQSDEQQEVKHLPLYANHIPNYIKSCVHYTFRLSLTALKNYALDIYRKKTIKTLTWGGPHCLDSLK